MPEIPPPPVPTQLIVFADDWGRHPSSSQHLVRELLPQYPTLWVNTVGTRKPRLNLNDLSRAFNIALSWIDRPADEQAAHLPEGLSVCAPVMYPGYRARWQRRVNARQVASAVRKQAMPGCRTVVITTLPTTADLIGRLGADRWIYYCVDDYSQWPGADHVAMDTMERALVAGVSATACVSQTLRDRVQSLGEEHSSLVTHGVSVTHWQTPDPRTALNKRWPGDDWPAALFWGLLDERLDLGWCQALDDSRAVHAVYAGPFANDPQMLMDTDAICLGPVPYADLPAHAAAASVLIMPYIDAPVTQAMQPLKLLEYLATMKPVVVRDLPSTRAWADCCDLAADAESFVRLVEQRVQTGTPPEQVEARRRRLPGESWSAKAAQLAELINADR